MVVMALDHSRDFIGGFGRNPTDLSTTNYFLFFTRFITHFCAPVFVLLAGTGAYLSRARKSQRELARFLVTRGLWLVLLEVTVVRTGWILNVNYKFAVFQVIWAIGWSMVALAALVFLPTVLVGVFGVLMIVLHNLLDVAKAADFDNLSWLWKILHEQGQLHPTPDRMIMLAYPLIPWIGVMAAGYAFGAYLAVEPALRRRRLFLLGGALTLAFVILRASNLYGDPTPWTSQPRGAGFTFLSFLNCQKYPPSLCYLLMTLGPSLLALGALERPLNGVTRVFQIFGRVPLFYYLLHLYMLHLVSFVFIAPQFIRDAAFRAQFLQRGTPNYGLPVTYAVWLTAVALLYPLCKKYAAFKQRSRATWVSYL